MTPIFSSLSLSLLLLSGPFLFLSVRGLAPMLVLSGVCALLALTSSPRFVDTVFLKRNALSIATVGLLVTSALWGISERAAETALRLVLVLAFMLAIPVMFERLDVESQQKWSRYLASSMALGIVCVLLIGPYNLYLPALEDWLSPYLELLRQVNAALAIFPVFLFLLLAQARADKPLFVFALLGIALAVAAVSQSQTSLLAMLLGLIGLGLASVSIRLCRNIIFVTLLASTLLAPFVFRIAYEQKWVERYTPSLLQDEAAGQTRSFIYYVFSQEALKRPLLGHGINATKNFVPETLSEYAKLTHDRPKAAANLQVWQASGGFVSHAHNLFLQIIFEFGYIGALLILATIWQLLVRLEARSVGHPGAPFIWASISAALGSMMFGYTIWHSWVIATLAFMVVFSRLLRPQR